MCRTRLIYVILGCLLAVSLDYFVFQQGVPVPPEAVELAPEQFTTVKVELQPVPPTVAAADPVEEAFYDPLLEWEDDSGVEPQITPPIALPPVVPAQGIARIVIVIDDMGVAVKHSAEMVAISEEFTLSFLPYASDLQAQMQIAKDAGNGLMVHMPMQPVGGDNPGPDAIMAGMAEDEIIRLMEANLDKAIPVAGINNHMGSKATADRATMDAVMRVLKARGMFFLDSVTTQESAAKEAADAAGVTYLRRDLFLDHYPDEASVLKALRDLQNTAARNGQAIAIGHPRPATMAALRQWLPTLDKQHFVIVPITDLLQVQPVRADVLTPP